MSWEEHTRRKREEIAKVETRVEARAVLNDFVEWLDDRDLCIAAFTGGGATDGPVDADVLVREFLEEWYG